LRCACMGVKHIVEDRAVMPERVRGLMAMGYNHFRIFLAGSREHKNRGLAPEKALIRTWRE